MSLLSRVQWVTVKLHSLGCFAKSLNRPFEFVIGGASDSHSLRVIVIPTRVRLGDMVDILHKCGSMNPIICFDELDKVSETAKGDEIINMLIHMTIHHKMLNFRIII